MPIGRFGTGGITIRYCPSFLILDEIAGSLVGSLPKKLIMPSGDVPPARTGISV